MNDYEIPAIELSVTATENLGKYSRMRKQYLQAHRPGLYNSLLLSGTYTRTCWKSTRQPANAWNG